MADSGEGPLLLIIADFLFSVFQIQIPYQNRPGSSTYNYNQLSRMSSETRNFTGLGSFTINYQYNLAGDLSSISDPSNVTINYTPDGSGRLTGISGTPFAGITTYASNIKYRAWDAIKYLNSGDNRTLTASFNPRLKASAFTVSGVISKTYDYYADGRLRFSRSARSSF